MLRSSPGAVKKAPTTGLRPEARSTTFPAGGSFKDRFNALYPPRTMRNPSHRQRSLTLPAHPTEQEIADHTDALMEEVNIFGNPDSSPSSSSPMQPPGPLWQAAHRATQMAGLNDDSHLRAADTTGGSSDRQPAGRLQQPLSGRIQNADVSAISDTSRDSEVSSQIQLLAITRQPASGPIHNADLNGDDSRSPRGLAGHPSTEAELGAYTSPSEGRPLDLRQQQTYGGTQYTGVSNNNLRRATIASGGPSERKPLGRLQQSRHPALPNFVLVHDALAGPSNNKPLGTLKQGKNARFQSAGSYDDNLLKTLDFSIGANQTSSVRNPPPEPASSSPFLPAPADEDDSVEQHEGKLRTPLEPKLPVKMYGPYEQAPADEENGFPQEAVRHTPSNPMYPAADLRLQQWVDGGGNIEVARDRRGRGRQGTTLNFDDPKVQAELQLALDVAARKELERLELEDEELIENALIGRPNVDDRGDGSGQEQVVPGPLLSVKPGNMPVKKTFVMPQLASSRKYNPRASIGGLTGHLRAPSQLRAAATSAVNKPVSVPMSEALNNMETAEFYSKLWPGQNLQLSVAGGLETLIGTLQPLARNEGYMNMRGILPREAFLQDFGHKQAAEYEDFVKHWEAVEAKYGKPNKMLVVDASEVATPAPASSPLAPQPVVRKSHTHNIVSGFKKSISKSCLSNLAKLPSMAHLPLSPASGSRSTSTSRPLSPSEIFEQPPRLADDDPLNEYEAKSQLYWAGRFESRNERLMHKPEWQIKSRKLAKELSKKSPGNGSEKNQEEFDRWWDQEEKDRAKVVFKDLWDYCKTVEARRSLKDYQIAKARKKKWEFLLPEGVPMEPTKTMSMAGRMMGRGDANAREMSLQRREQRDIDRVNARLAREREVRETEAGPSRLPVPREDKGRFWWGGKKEKEKENEKK